MIMEEAMNVWGARGRWEISVRSFQFYCKPNTALKIIKSLRKKTGIFCNYLRDFFGNKI